MTRREYAGNAVVTTLTGSIASSGGGTVTIAASTNWPTGASFKFHVIVDPLNSSAEKILVDSRSGTTLTYSSGGRGADGTSATAHSSGATIWVCITALDLDEANAHINATSAAHAGSAISFPASGTIAATTVTTAIQELDTEHTARLAAIEANNWVTSARILADAITTVKLLDGNVTVAKLASPDVLSLTASAASNLAGATLGFTFDTEVSDPNAFITAPSDTITVPASFGGLYVIVLKTSGSSITNTPIILVNDGSNSSYVGGARADARNNVTATLRLAVGNTIKAFSINGSGSTDSRSAALLLHRIAP